MVETIRVLIVDDHPVVRHGLRGMLSSFEDICVAGEAENGSGALAAVNRVQPHVILLDVRMPGQDGIEVARQIKRLSPGTKVIMLSMYEDVGYVTRSFEAAADGYLLKRVAPNDIAEAIRSVHRGKRVVAPEVASDLLGQFSRIAAEHSRSALGLSEAELRILEGMAQGASNRELTEQLFWSEATVRRKIQDIYRKLNVSDRAEAVAVAIRRGLI